MGTGEPLYRKILEDLLAAIQGGTLKPGDRLPAEAELEARWGVSRITAARAIKELQQLGLVHRMRGSGTFVNPAPAHGPASGTRTANENRMPRFIAAIFPQIERNGIPEILGGIEAACGEAGLVCTFHNSNNDLATEARLIRQVTEQGCSGLLLYPCFAPLGNARLYSDLGLRGFPIAMIDRSIDFLGLPLFACDNEASMAALTRHVIARGHRRIAFFCHSIETISSEQERFRGYGGALLEAGIPLDPDLVCRTAPSHGPEARRPDRVERDRLAEMALDHLLSLADRPSCVMAVNDLLGISLIKAALARGLRIPADLAVTGFDNIDAGDLAGIPLTTVAQPFHRIGREAAALLAGRLTGTPPGTPAPPGGGRIPGTLVIRQSA